MLGSPLLGGVGSGQEHLRIAAGGADLPAPDPGGVDEGHHRGGRLQVGDSRDWIDGQSHGADGTGHSDSTCALAPITAGKTSVSGAHQV